MRYLTQEFAHAETLDRARRWLIQAGVPADRVHAYPHGIPRLTVEAEASEVDSVEMIIRAASHRDPEGLPGIFDLARLASDARRPAMSPATATQPDRSFVLAWHAVDGARDEAIAPQIELQRAYRETRD